jgi:hypothetical protein
MALSGVLYKVHVHTQRSLSGILRSQHYFSCFSSGIYMIHVCDSHTHTTLINCTWCGYEVPGMILLRNSRELYDLIVVKTSLCMYYLAPVMISMH